MKTIPLKHPIIFAGREIKEITIKRRAKGKDLIAANKAANNDVERQIHLLANICEIEPEVLGELDAADFTELNKELESFLS